METLLIIGAGAHGRVVAETAVDTGLYSVLGFADDDPNTHGKLIDGWSVTGFWSEVEADAFIVAIGNNERRCNIFQCLRAAHKSVATIISPRSFVSRFAILGLGTVVLPGAVIQASSTVGDNVIVNIGVVVDHDAHVGDHSHLAPNSTVTSFANIAVGEMLPPGGIRSRS